MLKPQFQIKKSVLLIGLASSTTSAAKLLDFCESGLTFSYFDDRIVESSLFPFVSLDNIQSSSLSFAMAILSPGVPLSHPIVSQLLSLQIPIFSEIEVGMWYLPHSSQVIGITGSNGKSTCTHFLAQLIQFSQRNALSCGNIGTPFTEAVLETLTQKEKHPNPIFCIELSSYQLETTFSSKIDYGILLNLQEDHLQRYGTLEHYLKAKWKLTQLLTPNGVCIIDSSTTSYALKLGLNLVSEQIEVLDCSGQKLDDSRPSPEFANHLKDWLKMPMCYQSLNLLQQKNLEPFWSYQVHFSQTLENHQFEIFDIKNQRKLFIDNCVLPGSHNAQNLSFAICIAQKLGISNQTTSKFCHKETSSYLPLAHRLEPVFPSIDSERTQNLRFINDSKATNVSSCLVAAKTLNPSTPCCFLVGGKSKHELFYPLFRELEEKNVHLFLFGEASEEISSQLKEFEVKKPIKYSCFQTLQMTLEFLRLDLPKSGTILLSPGCASFDEFKNFEHRGHFFRSWAQNL